MAETAKPSKQLYDKPDTAILIYVLYLSSLVLGITALVGLVWAYMERKNSAEWLQSHYTYIINTFWKGLLYSVIGAVTSMIMIGILVLLLTVIWWIVRCIKGLKAASKREPIPDPKTWLF